MKSVKRLLTHGIALFAFALTSSVYAEARKMNVSVEVLNEAGQDLYMTSADFYRAGMDLSRHRVPVGSLLSFGVQLDNLSSDVGVFKMKSGDKACEFKMEHKSTFRWFSVKVAPEKFAIARSVGKVAAQCQGAVIRGEGSFGSYAVRFTMK